MNQTAALLDIHQLAATIQAGTRFRFHPADPHDMPSPEYLLTATESPHTCPEGLCVPFAYPPEFTARHDFETGQFCSGLADNADRFEIVEANRG